MFCLCFFSTRGTSGVFSDGRLIAMGKSSRCLLLSIALGLPSLLAHMKAAGESQYYIGGFEKHCTSQVKMLTSLVATCSGVSDSVLQLIMKDDRLPLLLPEIDEAIQRALQKVCDISPSVWAFLGKVTEVAPSKLRSDAMTAAVTSAGYMLERIRAARCGAWALLQGDRLANIRK